MKGTEPCGGVSLDEVRGLRTFWAGALTEADEEESSQHFSSWPRNTSRRFVKLVSLQ